jgi:hypothetical protein
MIQCCPSVFIAINQGAYIKVVFSSKINRAVGPARSSTSKRVRARKSRQKALTLDNHSKS